MDNIAASICAGWNSSCILDGPANDVPPSTRSIIESVSRLLHPCSDVWRISSFWWESADNVPVAVIALSLKESGLQVDVIEGKVVVGSKLAG